MPDTATQQRTQQPPIKFGRGGRFTVPLLLDCLTAAGILPENPDDIPDIQPIQDDLLSYLDRIAYLEQVSADEDLPLSNVSLDRCIQFIIYTQPRERGELVISPDGNAAIEWRWQHGVVYLVFGNKDMIKCYCRSEGQSHTKRSASFEQIVRFIKSSGFKDVLY